MRQLELFAADQVKVRSGFEALERLDIDAAEEIFEDLVRRFDDVQETASEAKAACSQWRDLDLECSNTDPIGRAQRLWTALTSESGISGHARTCLRKGLAAQLLNDNTLGWDITSTGLCNGTLLITLDRWQEAEAWYREVLQKHPRKAVARRQLGDLLWLAQRRHQARLEYRNGLLEAPEDFSSDNLPDRELGAIIDNYGTQLAPIYGWLAHLFSLPEDDLPSSHTGELIALILTAEEARKRGDHDAIVECRQKILDHDQKIFSAYMGRFS